MVRIKDIAQLAQVSDAAVSRVLNGDASFSVSEQTRQRILVAAAELGYKPNRSRKAKEPESGRRFQIGLLLSVSQVDEANDPYYLSIRLGIEKQCLALGLDLKTTLRMDQWLTTDDFSDLDGLIVVGSIDQRPLRQVYAQNDNLVFVHNLHHHDPDYDAVWSDLERATEMCLDELVALGHRSIGYIGGPDSIQNIITHESQDFRDIRDLTFERKMKELGLFNPDQVWRGNWSAAEGQRLAAAAIAQGALPTAFLIGSDPLSMGALRAFREAGISVPEDLSIISFDDIEAAAYMSPPLSTVRLHTEEIGRQATKTLYDRLLGREVVVNVVIPCQLVRRQSHARAK